MPYIIEKTFNSEIFTKVGNPTITDDGIASGFSSSNNITSPFASVTPSQIILRTKGIYSSTPNAANGSQVFGRIQGTNSSPSIEYNPNGNRLAAVRFHNNSSISNFSARIIVPLNDGDIVEAEVIATSTSVTINAKINGVQYTNTWSGNGLYCGAVSGWQASITSNYYWTGSIDLKACQLIINDKIVLNGTTSKEVYVLPSIQELKDYYSNTLIVQYYDKPKAKQTIEMLVYLVFSEMLLFQVQNAFNWKTAVGKQLDVIGQWVGVSRTFNINLLTEPKLAYPQYDRLDPDTTSALQGGYSDYESFDTLQGGQLRYSDIQTTTNNLNDDNYRIIIGLKIIFNSINHTAKAIDDAIWEYFNHEVYTVWTDNTLTYYYPSNLAQVMLFADYKGVLPAPTGVTVQLTEI